MMRNGLAFSLDGKRLYVDDSAPKNIVFTISSSDKKHQPQGNTEADPPQRSSVEFLCVSLCSLWFRLLNRRSN